MSSSDQDYVSSSQKSPGISKSTSTHKTKSDLTTIVKAQVSLLISSLSRDNYKKTAVDIESLISTHGRSIRIHLLRLLVVRAEDPTSSTAILLAEQVRQITESGDPQLLQTLAEALLFAFKSESFKDTDLESFLGQEQFSIDPVDKVSLVIEIYLNSTNGLRRQASQIIEHNFQALLDIISDLQYHKRISDETIELHLKFFKSELDNFGASFDILQAYSLAVKSRFASTSIPKILISLLSDGQSTMDNEVDKTYLSERMLSLGYGCCSSPAMIRDTLNQLGRNITEEDIAHVLGMMVRTEQRVDDNTNSSQTWDVNLFFSTLSEVQPDLNFTMILQSLDYEQFIVYDAKGFEILVNAYQSYGYEAKSEETFPVHVFWGRWKNLRGQLSVLYHMAHASTTFLNLTMCNVRLVIHIEDFAANTAVRSAAAQLATQQLNCLDLIETVINLADTELAENVKLFVEQASSRAPELIFLGLCQIQSPGNAIRQEYINRLLTLFLNGQPTSPLVFARLWQVDPSLLVSGLLNMYNKDSSTLSRILDIAQDLKILSQLLQINSFTFTIDLAALASRREYLNLEKWLRDNITEYKDPFTRACLDFLSEKIANDVSRQDANSGSQSQSLEVMATMAIFLKVITASSISPENQELLSACLQAYPGLMNVKHTADPIGSEFSFSADVEKEVNSYFERIYAEEITVDQMIGLLERFKNSKDPRQEDIFACMVHILFDEYRFFPKYPPAELAITSALFGSLIQHKLVSYIPLGIALRYVLDALRNPVGSKMFGFGLQALTRFQSRLHEWPQYCSHLLQIQQLQQAQPEIFRSIQQILLNSGQQESLTDTADSFQTEPMQEPAKTKENQHVFTSLNVDTLVAASDDVQVPEEAVQDKILFIINNVAQSNFEAKVSELNEILQESTYQWFSNYLVVKRASIEPNYHQLYLLMLDALDRQQLFRHILHETFSNVKVLLNSEKTVHSSSERTLLKNLGSWLGGMTLARNKPIKHKNIAFKELLIEGYDSNRLIVVIPFVCKVLEQCAKSKVFKPPNPWSIAILRLLVELYQYADLKLNLKFEIEVLCKSLNIELSDIHPTDILKNRPPKGLVTEGNALAVDFTSLSVGGYDPNARQSSQDAQQTSTSFVSSDEGTTIRLPDLSPYIVFNPQIAFASQPSLKRLVCMAIDRAIREIVGPVVERSVTIAGISTRELIIKDFAMEGDEMKMRKAAHLMVQTLAGSLAMVTCKEPLRNSMAIHMRNLFMQNGFTEHTTPEQAILLTVNDNLELACSIIEKAAMEKALPEIDEGLAAAFNSRKKHRERTSAPYYDLAVFSASRVPQNLPDALRLKQTGLNMQQLRVYDDFSRIPRLQNQVAGPYDSEHRSVRPEIIHGYGNPEAGFEQQYLSGQALERFAQLIPELDKRINQSSITSFTELPPENEIRILVQKISVLAASSFKNALHFAQKIVQSLYKAETNLGRETYVALLQKLCDSSLIVVKEVTAWLVYADDERKYNVPVTVALIKAGLIILSEQDLQLAKLIESGRPTVVDFTAKLIRICVLEDPPCASRQEFANSLLALERLAQRGKATDVVILLLDEMRRRLQGPTRESIREEENVGMRDRLSLYFADWVRLYQHPVSNEKTQLQFVNSLVQQGIFENDEIFSLFFRVCTEISVDHALKFKSVPTSSPSTSYHPIDAFSKFIVLLTRAHTDPVTANANAAKVNLITKILSIIVLVLAQHHEARRNMFNQKPFLRLFSSLLNDFHAFESYFSPIYFQILTSFGNTFQTLQPIFFPGFTFSWLQLISHRLFMPKLLLAENQKGLPTFQKLLSSLFTFLVPFLRNVELRETTRMLYRGTLRLLLVLLHDFPEFLCDYHFSFCDVIPPSCIQLRNLILSAFPRNMRLPDPFTPNLKVDLLPEISQMPRVLSDFTNALVNKDYKQEVDHYLRNRAPVSFLLDLRSKLLLDSNSQDVHSTGSKYNAPLINSLVLYVGMQAISQGTAITLTHSAPMDIFQQLLIELDSEGRYLFLSAIANQLRYPNSHTHYFSCVLLYLFAEGNQEIIKEQITRVLLERLIVNRPHPWGLLITFIELIKNPRYNFWNHGFTRCAADIEKLFESVSRSINQL